MAAPEAVVTPTGPSADPSQRSNTPVHELAAQIVARVAG